LRRSLKSTVWRTATTEASRGVPSGSTGVVDQCRLWATDGHRLHIKRCIPKKIDIPLKEIAEGESGVANSAADRICFRYNRVGEASLTFGLPAVTREASAPANTGMDSA
jgi:hypothetical protein